MQAVILPRLGGGPIPETLRLTVLAVLAGIFGLTVLASVASRSLSTSRTPRGTPTDRLPTRLELLPWLSGALLAGVAMIMWLISRS
jgi:hypothetical protein